MDKKELSSASGLWLRCFVALAVDVTGVWAVNAFLYPQYTALLPGARDLASVAGVATLVVLALWAQRRPASLNEPLCTAAAAALVPVGYGIVAVGLWQGSALMLGIGAVVRAVGSRWIVVIMGLALCRLGDRACMLCIAAAFAASYLARVPLAAASAEALHLFLLTEPFIMLVACRPAALRMLESMEGAVPPVDASITQPAAYLPFAHSLFAAIFVFRVAYGFALTFESVAGVPQQTMLGLVPLGLVALLALRPRLPRADVLYQTSALLVAAGFLSVIVLLGRSTAFQSVTNGLLFAGSECFEVLVWFVLASIGSRNHVNALAVFAWGKAASSAGLLFGATVGHAANAIADPLIEATLVAAVLFGFVAANVTVFKGLNFQGTIDGVRPVELPRPSAAPVEREGAHDGSDGDSDAVSLSLADRCAAVAVSYRLTPRETEILSLLAHGRNAPYIQEKLVLSRNTVKTHVQNIYAKLGVHSQQELIDLVEEAV